MIILGIDPSLNGTGFGVIKKVGGALHYITSGVISQKTNDAFHLKLLNISNVIDLILEEFTPQKAGIEETYINSNPQTSLKLGAVRGAVILTLAKREINIHEISPSFMKKSIASNGRADKNQIAFMIRHILSGFPKDKICKTEDETDALGIAIACSNLGLALKHGQAA